MDLLLPCLYAFLASFAFGLVSELHSWKYLLAAGFTGCVGWLVYLLLADSTTVPRFFVATIVVAVISEIFARIFKAPATVFLVVGIIPLVPGGGIYYTMEALINGEMATFMQKGMETAASAGAIAVGCSLVSSVARIITVYRRRRREERRRASEKKV